MKFSNRILSLLTFLCPASLLAVPSTVYVPSGTFVDSGETMDVAHGGQIETVGQVTVTGSGDAMFISSTKIVLKPGNNSIGFIASPGTGGSFWAVIDPDSDGDGMTDLWEVMNGLNPNNAADASLDFDGDDVSNLAEFNAGTSAMVHNSVGWFTEPSAIQHTGSGVGLTIVDQFGNTHAVNETSLLLQ